MIDKNPIQPPDYEQIASDYDRRYRQGPTDSMKQTIRSFMRQSVAGRWLEVGCGTGQWLLDPPDDLTVFGMDRSWNMLAKAAAKLSDAPLFQGNAIDLPIAGRCLDAVATIHAFHHFSDQDGFLNETYRVLRPGGGYLLVGMDAHDPSIEWYIYQFFEGTAARDRARFPDHERLIERLRELGFHQVVRGSAREVDERLIGKEILAQPFLRRRGCSQMALLSDEAYEAGIARIKKSIAENPAYEFRASLRLEYIWAVK